jgi:Spy/CpxP family protein refolding chaperone
MFKKLTLAAALAAGLTGSATALAHGPHGGFGGAAAELERLDLSDAQWLQVHKIMQGHRKAAHPLHKEQMELRKGFVTLDPGSADYAKQVSKLQDQAAQVARDRIQDMANLKSQVYAVLNDQQRAKLAKDEQAFGHHHPEQPPPKN